MRSHPVLSFLAVACLFACMHSSRADDEMDTAEITRLHQAGEILPLEQILERVRTRQSGAIIEVELERKRGQYVYEVDIVDDQGRKRELMFSAKTGELLGCEEDADDDENDNADDSDGAEEKS